MLSRFLATGVILVLALAVFAENTPAPFSIQWNTNNFTVRVVGSIQAEHRKLAPEELARIFPVVVEASNPLDSIGLPPIAGTYLASSRFIEFKPRFSFEPGLAYRATFGPAGVTSVLRIPRAAPARQARVSNIYPSTNQLPQNLLKFYIHFSAPMSGGLIYEHIHLLQEDGTPVELPFLEINEELWNRDMTRLTLFLDPGRIKREVRPLEEIGAALLPGKKYILRIDDAWLDARGAALQEKFEKHFSVREPDRHSPEPSEWRLSSPAAGTREALKITFDEPLDQALALRVIGVTGMNGAVSVGPLETSWEFKPEAPWKTGRHEIIVLSTIEDLAGNNIGKPFEVDLTETDRTRVPARTRSLFFEVH